MTIEKRVALRKARRRISEIIAEKSNVRSKVKRGFISRDSGRRTVLYARYTAQLETLQLMIRLIDQSLGATRFGTPSGKEIKEFEEDEWWRDDSMDEQLVAHPIGHQS
jgi:hypothetical protein